MLKMRSITSQLLLPSASAAERAQPPDEFLKVDRAAATASPPYARSVKQQASVEKKVGLGERVAVKGTHSSSKMAIIRDASGLLAICGICRNSLRSIEPEPSLFEMGRARYRGV